MVAGIAGGIGFLAICVIIGFMVYRRIKANKINRQVYRSLFKFEGKTQHKFTFISIMNFVKNICKLFSGIKFFPLLFM